jgi:BlaI family penicillinase repressor
MREPDFRTLGDSEYRFACIVWEHEPLGSGQLVQLAAEQLGWKKSTTYTVLKKLIEKGILQNEDSIVSSRVPKEQVRRHESTVFLDRTFNGSLPAFVAAFLGENTLSAQDAAEIRAMLDASQTKEGGGTC